MAATGAGIASRAREPCASRRPRTATTSGSGGPGVGRRRSSAPWGTVCDTRPTYDGYTPCAGQTTGAPGGPPSSCARPAPYVGRILQKDVTAKGGTETAGHDREVARPCAAASTAWSVGTPVTYGRYGSFPSTTPLARACAPKTEGEASASGTG